MMGLRWPPVGDVIEIGAWLSRKGRGPKKTDEQCRIQRGIIQWKMRNKRLMDERDKANSPPEKKSPAKSAKRRGREA